MAMHTLLKILLCTFLALSFSGFVDAQTLKNMVTVADGLDVKNPENIQDDYVRMTLINPDYSTAIRIRNAVEAWLGPDMVTIKSRSFILIQAPRESSARVEFIAALLALEI